MERAAKLTPAIRQEYGLGVEQLQAGRWVEAEATYRRILAQLSKMPEAHLHLGLALKNQRRLEPAVASFRTALALRPGYLEAWNNLGNTLRMQYQPALAIEAYRRSLALRQDIPLAWSNLALVLHDTGQSDEALACLDRAIAMAPGDMRAYCDRLFMLRHHQRFDAPAILHEARQWAERFAKPLSGEVFRHDNDCSRERRLRVGYVSAEFRAHCESLFTTPLFSRHDHDAFEIFCYSDVAEPDGVTARLQRHADVWRPIQGMSDAQVAELIHRDQIDILVDLALHTAGCRLLVFARKPAPIQVTWLAYPGTTGLDAIDYRFTDPRLVPLDIPAPAPAPAPAPGSDITDTAKRQAVPAGLASIVQAHAGPNEAVGIQEDFYAERSVYLPDCFWCYDPYGMDGVTASRLPDPGPLPALSTGCVTFGALNNFNKVTDRTLELWARVLAALPTARLLMFSPPGLHRERVVQKLGVAPERVRFVPFQMRLKYLETYRQIDLCLDTLPCGGGTTSFDALWMGVPLLTRVGQTVAGRAGWSLLHHLGLAEELVAHSDEQFVRQAVAWAGDLDRLAGVRAMLRQRMENSALMDAGRFARNVEAAYRQMWREWCGKRSQ